MSRLSDLLRQVERNDPRLAADLAEELSALSQRRPFGLNFERHVPESVELYGRPVRKGDKVRCLPPRGESPKAVGRTIWSVAGITRAESGRMAQLVRPEPDGDGPGAIEYSVEDLVVVAEFRDPIYPGLVSTGRVERGGDKPFHTVINAENFHALQLLLYTHEGKVDAIYIDPPYNTGAKDWKYNNDYVDGEDAYRHSKWLAFMERRLKLARRLLNPEDSVLIVTIDEKEYLRLGLLLQQIFPEADLQMVSVVINRAGSSRSGRFARVDEYAFYVFLGRGRVTPWTSTMLDDASEDASMPTIWFTAIRRGTASAERSARPNLFYPVYLDAATGRFSHVGAPLPADQPRETVDVPEGLIAIWPLGPGGREQTWRFSAQRMREFFENGTARLGKRDPETGTRPITYLQPGTLAKIADGTFQVTGRSNEGALEIELANRDTLGVTPRTVWSRPSHFARDQGSSLLTSLLGSKRFEFPKALYAVEDAIRFCVATKPDALVLDFFAGSGTTAHAVMRLNRQDGGHRQSISVTNNEVSAEEQRVLRERGHRPGDPAWEQHGIAEYVTRPRITAAVTGHTPSGEPIKGDYRFTDEFPMDEGFEENVEFFTMSYEAPRAVAHHRSFEAIAPLLWLKAGARGCRIEQSSDDFAVADAYAVLFDTDSTGEFLAALKSAEGVRMVFIVTDDDRAFQMVSAELSAGVETVRLYSSYLTNFAINTGRS